MPQTYTPLRYPGGKSKLYKYIGKLLSYNELEKCIYVEPFAGGAGLALSLLIKKNVSEIIINDFDFSVFSFWYCVINYTDKLIKAIERVEINIDEWYKQKEIQKNQQKYDIFDIGFSTLFLNRVNRSGIIKGGVIGGINQSGKYKLDCRFNKSDLIKKINRIASYKEKIKIFNYDAKNFIPEVIAQLPTNTLIYFDPPYILQGSKLYCNYFTKKDHIELSNLIKKVNLPWILTYDKESLVYQMYHEYKIIELNLRYSAGPKRNGTELMVFGKNLLPVSPNL